MMDVSIDQIEIEKYLSSLVRNYDNKKYSTKAIY